MDSRIEQIVKQKWLVAFHAMDQELINELHGMVKTLHVELKQCKKKLAKYDEAIEQLKGESKWDS